jgi:ribose transport system substrate-binding protein
MRAVSPPTPRRLAAFAVATVAVLALAACGSGSSGPSAPAASGGSGGGIAAGVPTIAELTGQGTEAEPPTTGPAPARGKKVWWVSCGMSLPDCSVPAQSAQEAAGKLGFDFQIADGRLNADGGNVKAVETALAASPDAIVLHGIACGTVRAPLQEAKRRGVLVLGVETLDCDYGNASAGDADKLFTADMQYAPGILTNEAYFQAWGKNLADYLINESNGDAQILDLAGQSYPNKVIGTAFGQQITDKCPGCTVVQQIEYQQSEQVPNGPMIQRFRTALVQNPDATAVNYESGANAGPLGAVQAADQVNPQLIGVSGTGLAPELDLVRSGKLTMVTAHSSEWMGYAAMDQINRQVQGQPAAPQGVGFRSVDKDHNLPPAAGMTYQTPIDFVAGYDKLWGVAQ